MIAIYILVVIASSIAGFFSARFVDFHSFSHSYVSPPALLAVFAGSLTAAATGAGGATVVWMAVTSCIFGGLVAGTVQGR